MAANNLDESSWRQTSFANGNAMTRFCFLVAALVMLLPNAGCGLMANAMYIIKGNDAPAEFDDLKEKKVAIIVGTEAGLNADASGTIMSRQINAAISRNVKKVDMVNPEEVDRIINDQPVGDRSISTIGNRLRADYVILVEVADLKLREGQTLYRGRSNATVTAYNVREGDRPVYKKSFPEFIYPQYGAPITDFDEVTFQRIYLSELSSRIARIFYPYDPSIDVAKDASVSSLGAGQ